MFQHLKSTACGNEETANSLRVLEFYSGIGGYSVAMATSKLGRKGAKRQCQVSCVDVASAQCLRF